MSYKVDGSKLVPPRFMGIPYKLGGRSFDGADCVGVAMLYLKEHGLDYSGEDLNLLERATLEGWYERNPRRFVDRVLQLGKPVPFAEVRRFDLLLFFSPDGVSKFPTGMGIMVDPRHFLGCVRPGEESRVEMLNVIWKSMLWGCLRLHRAVDEGLSQWE